MVVVCFCFVVVCFEFWVCWVWLLVLLGCVVLSFGLFVCLLSYVFVAVITKVVWVGFGGVVVWLFALLLF